MKKKQVYLYGGTITIKKRLHISVCETHDKKCVMFFLKKKDAEKAYGKENVIKVEFVR